MSYRILLIIFGFLLIPNQTTAQDKLVLTLDASIRLGWENSRKLKSAAYDYSAAEAKSRESFSEMLPSLTFSGKYAQLSEVPPFSVEMGLPAPFPQEITISEAILDYYSLKLTVQQPLFTGFRLKHLSASAKYDASAAEWACQTAENELRWEIASAFWQLYKMQEYQKVFAKNLTMLDAHLKDAENFYRQGLVTKDELLKVESQRASAKLLLLKSENSVAMANLILKNKIGLELDAVVEIQAESALPENSLASTYTAKEMALENRPELKALDNKLLSVKALSAASASGYYPQIFLSGNYYYENPHQRYMPAEDEFHDSWDVGIGLSYTLWNWGKTSRQRQQTISMYKKTQETVKEMRDGIILEVTQSKLELEQAVQQNIAARQALDAAEASYKIVGELYQQGMTLNSEMLDAESALLKAQIDYQSILADYQIAAAKFRRAAGINTEY